MIFSDAFLSCSAVVLLPGLVAAAALEPLVVTATRSDQATGDVPYSFTLLDQDDLRERSIRTLPEALQLTPGVLVQKTAHGQGSPFIRGFTGRQNLLLVDGVRLNNSTFRSGPLQYWSTVDALAIDHLELIKSQGSVLFGSDAVGGTLNAFTKGADFRDHASNELFSHGATGYEFRSNGQGSHIGRFESQTGVGQCFGLWLGLSAKEFGDIEDDAVGRMSGTGYPERDLDLRADWALTADSTLTAVLNYVDQDAVSRWHRTRNNPGWNHDGHVVEPGLWTRDDFDQERSLAYLRYAGENHQAGAPIQRWSATLSYQSSNDSEFQNRLGDPQAGSRPVRGSLIETNSSGADILLESACGPGKFVYGLDYYHDDVDSAGYQTNPANTNRRESLPIGDDSTYDLLGVFSQYVWRSDAIFEVTGGARYTWADASVGRYYNAKNIEQPGTSQSWDAFVGSVHGLYRVTADWTLFGGLAQAFRAPNLDDLSGNMTARAGNDSLGSLDLDPEKFLTCELGVRHSEGDLSVSLAVFYTDARDLIVPVAISPTSSTTVASNAGDGYVYGLELEASWQLSERWLVSGFAAWQDARTETPVWVGGPVNDKPNARQMPMTGSLALRWTDPSQRFWAEGRVSAAAAEDRITEADQYADRTRIPSDGTPAYLTAGVHAGWKVNSQLDLHGGLENISDADYRHHGSGQNEAGFNAIFGARIMW